MNKNGAIGLFDFSHSLVVAFKSLGKQQGPNDAENHVMVQLAGVRSACERVVVCLDSKPYWRSELFPEYKSNREREPELVSMWKRCIERLSLDGYQVARAPKAECDDVMATLAREYVDEGFSDIRLYTVDKDLLSCVNESVRCFAYVGSGEWEIRDANWVRTKFGGINWDDKTPGPEPEHIPMVLSIMGDGSDNIPGIKGIGVKGAVKLVHAYKDFDGMAKACVAQVEASKMGGKLPAFWRDYAVGMANLPLYLKLTTLDDHAPLDKHPLAYLEKLEMKPLVKTEDNAFDGAFDDGPPPEDVDWDEIEAKVEAETREQMAASLPVDPTPKGAPAGAASTVTAAATAPTNREPEERRQEVADHVQQSYPRTKRDEALKAAEKILNPELPAPKATAAATPVAAAGATEAPTSAQQIPASAAGSSRSTEPASGPSAEVVPKTQGPQEPKAPMVVVPPPSWELATQPRSPSEMLKVAVDLFNSRLFGAYGNHNAVFTVIALGRELGLGMSQALAGFFIVEQRPYMSAALCRALVQRHPDCDYFLCKHADEKSATWILRRKSWPQGFESSLTYSWEQATKAGLTTGKNRFNWDTKPVEMLTKTAAAKLGKRDFADATFGLDVDSEVV